MTHWHFSNLSFRWAALLLAAAVYGRSEVIYDATTAYHNVRVADDDGVRTLFFDDATESRMSIQNPTQGHCEYTEYFHMAWLWNARITNVVMVGLGGAITQRSFEHYYPWVNVQTAEIDPVVLQVAKDYFHLKESERQKVQIADGRVFLRRSVARSDLILMDAYVQGRYGAGIPQHLATKEFFELVRGHLNTNGVMAYNVIGTMSDWHADIVGAIYRTLKEVFPQVYFFPAQTTRNVVILATMSPERLDLGALRRRAAQLVQQHQPLIPAFRERLEVFHPLAPANSARSPVLTDDFAPVEGLAGGGGPGERVR